MIRKVANFLTDLQIKKEKISSEDRAVFSYAYEVALGKLFHIFLSILIGIIFGKIIEMIVFLICYGSLRRHAGGYHASTRLRCTMISVSLLGIVMVMNHLSYNLISQRLFFILLITISVGVALLSPVEAVNKPLELSEKKINKIATIGILIFLDLIAYLGVVMLQSKLLIYNILIVCLAVFILQLMGVIRHKKHKK